MRFRALLEFLGGATLILFGLLFLVYLPHDFSEVSTDAIFIVFGLLFVRKGVSDQKMSEVKPQTRVSNKAGKKSARKNKEQQKTKARDGS